MQKIARFKPTRPGDPPLHTSDRKKKKREKEGKFATDNERQRTSGREEGCEALMPRPESQTPVPCK